MMRWRSTVLLVLIMTITILLLSSCLNIKVIAAESLIKVMVNGKQLSSDVTPFTAGGRVLVPFRAIFESLGAKVTWDAQSKMAMGRKNLTCILLQTDNKKALILVLKPDFNEEITSKNLEQAVESSKNIILDVPATAKNGRIMVPVRFIAESLGAKVDWNSSTRAVSINTNGKAQMPVEPEKTAVNDKIIGVWSSEGPSGSMVDPSTGVIEGSY